MGKNSLRVLTVVAVCLLVVLSFLAGSRHARNASQAYPLLDPSVFNPRLSQDLVDFDPLRQEVKTYLAKTGIDHSFYFEYLPNGVSIRDGSEQEAVAASLLKTPVVMDLYKLAEVGKLNLEDTVKIAEQDISNDPVYGDPSDLQAGQTISLRNAARIALQKSDNTAISVIRRTIQPLVTTDTDVFESLDVNYTVSSAAAQNDAAAGTDSKTVLISARSYSSIQKCLYYSCFLRPQDSQEILTYLIGSVGQEFLPAGVTDKSVKIAHKIGSGPNVDSDCGIFYVPMKPYLVCLIFRGTGTGKPNDTNKHFQHVSKTVYDYVASQR